MPRLLFTAPDAWNGGEYELVLEFGAIPDAEFRSALMALWAFPALDGCYLKRDREPYEQDRVPPETLDLVSNSNFGVARLPKVPFQLGLIGVAVGGETSANELSRTGVPDKKEIGYLWPINGELQHFPKSAQPSSLESFESFVVNALCLFADS